MTSKYTIRVDLGDRGYPIYLGRGNLAFLGHLCRKHEVPPRVVVIADRNSARVALGTTLDILRAGGYKPEAIVMPPGERQKSLVRVGAIQERMLRMNVSRDAAVLALGGGVVGDVAGLVASTFRRGLPLVQCPTTLLSQVDSSVGGKNGVNHPLSKNAIGTFHQPAFVLSDVDLLKTLPRREALSGLGEILKYPLVGDPSLLTYLENHLEGIIRFRSEHVLRVAASCLRIKAALVSEDEREILTDRGRVLLNVGHVVGHALESLSHYRLRHGEAVLLGILAEGSIAVRRGWLAEGTMNRMTQVYLRLRPRYRLTTISNSLVQRFIFQKNPPRFVLPVRLGRVRVVRDVTPAELVKGLEFLRSL